MLQAPSRISTISINGRRLAVEPTGQSKPVLVVATSNKTVLRDVETGMRIARPAVDTAVDRHLLRFRRGAPRYHRLFE